MLPALDQIIDMGHALARMATLIDWKFLDDRLGPLAKPVRVNPHCRHGLSRPVHPERHAQP
ncbi:hypothetical protein [Bradyrhizobium niftali]|uniref:hypothetical protein n=1 Tax=Bradyrhizobium niftali TaxID=2560055 RepID=UPI001ADDCCA0|nr:hypothetical protein [Bradyrhizobium niftali]